MNLTLGDLLYLIVLSIGGIGIFLFHAIILKVLTFKFALIIYALIAIITINAFGWFWNLPNIYQIVLSMLIVYTVILIDILCWYNQHKTKI
ncbi:hypothetical protein P9B03_02120 [Metasolibacillus meyeri]|uniref:DUF2651 domain-containing protein n=1 Tax=Metasolibacillus meyeri TaxID=1071052 RepID=A0AAW9NL74_9BACL|nr:hypothetical protein [Metasolibacillus meyeri]MEC1177267.1 hypothetical protein [Metasolibacillus meyeri]